MAVAAPDQVRVYNTTALGYLCDLLFHPDSPLALLVRKEWAQYAPGEGTLRDQLVRLFRAVFESPVKLEVCETYLQVLDSPLLHIPKLTYGEFWHMRTLLSKIAPFFRMKTLSLASLCTCYKEYAHNDLLDARLDRPAIAYQLACHILATATDETYRETRAVLHAAAVTLQSDYYAQTQGAPLTPANQRIMLALSEIIYRSTANSPIVRIGDDGVVINGHEAPMAFDHPSASGSTPGPSVSYQGLQAGTPATAGAPRKKTRREGKKRVINGKQPRGMPEMPAIQEKFYSRRRPPLVNDQFLLPAYMREVACRLRDEDEANSALELFVRLLRHANLNALTRTQFVHAYVLQFPRELATATIPNTRVVTFLVEDALTGIPGAAKRKSEKTDDYAAYEAGLENLHGFLRSTIRDGMMAMRHPQEMAAAIIVGFQMFRPFEREEDAMRVGCFMANAVLLAEGFAPLRASDITSPALMMAAAMDATKWCKGRDQVLEVPCVQAYLSALRHTCHVCGDAWKVCPGKSIGAETDEAFPGPAVCCAETAHTKRPCPGCGGLDKHADTKCPEFREGEPFVKFVCTDCGSRGVQRCSGCHGVWYCSAACQQADYTVVDEPSGKRVARHKNFCLRNRAAAKEVAKQGQ